MTRVVSLFLPTWSTDRLRRKAGDAAPPAEAPLVLIGREGSRRVVLAVDAAAHAAGLRVGMPVTKAQVLVPGLIIQDADPAADAEALELDDLVPIEPAAMVDRQVIEWDKDDIDALRFMKVDVLALGMLTCMKCGLDLLAEHKGINLDLATIPAEDPRTYAMIRKADTLGTFQIESRAQMSMLPRLKPRTYYDLVVQVAIVRPGPIQGDMVHPYAILTIEANADVAPFHDRQMAVIRREQCMDWLDRTCREDQLLRPLLAGSFKVSRQRDEPRQAELTF